MPDEDKTFSGCSFGFENWITSRTHTQLKPEPFKEELRRPEQEYPILRLEEKETLGLIFSWLAVLHEGAHA